jgi:phage/plasmid-associated DNA primase
MASGLDGINYQKIWFFEGAGGNGKGLGLSLNECVLGDGMYKTACGDILTADGQKANQSSEDIMNLKNARMAVFNEMDKNEGMTWSSLKVLTGGDTMTGRRLYKGLEQFKLSCSVIGAFNNKPDMVGHTVGDERASLERRLKPIHFPFIFTEDPVLLEMGLPYKKADIRFVEPKWRLSVRDVYLDLLLTVYVRAFSKQTNTFIFNEPEKVRLACQEYLRGEDLFLELFNELCMTDSEKKTDIPANRLFLGYLYEKMTTTETFRQGANGKGRKTFLRSWSKKKFIEWSQSRLGAKMNFKSQWYVCGYSLKDYMGEVEEGSIEEEIEMVEKV